MAIVKMKKLRLIALRSQREALLEELMLLGCVEILEPGNVGDGLSLVAADAGELSRLTALRTRVANALKLLDKYASVKTPMFARRREIPLERFFDESGLDASLETARHIVELDAGVKRIEADASHQRAVVDALIPWISLDLPLEIEGTNTCITLGGIVPASTDVDALRFELAQAAPEAELITVSEDKAQIYTLLVCMRDEAAAATELLRENGFARPPLPSKTGTALENIDSAEAKLRELAQEKASLEKAITGYSGSRDELKLCCDRLDSMLTIAEAARRMPATESVVLLQGWITSPNECELEETFASYTCAWELSDPLPEEYPDVPTCLKNNKLTEPMMMVTQMYSLPSYDGIDPNPLMLPFFTVFFGIMYGDIGYGIILTALGFLALKLKPKGTLKYMAGLLRLCGITTIVFGVLTGSFFGDAIPVVAGMYGKTADLWALFSPLKDPMIVLVGALAFGCVQIFVGMGIKAYMCIRDGHWQEALFDVGSWWLLFAGIAVGALAGFWWVAIAGVAALVLTQGRAKPTIIGKLVGGIASLYNITGYFGDILSYSRLMALMLASSVIASVFNTLGALFGNIVGFMFVFLIGHAFNMGLNIIGTYVHASRLMYLEYFGKFYKDGGKPFRPLRINTKYVDIKEES